MDVEAIEQLIGQASLDDVDACRSELAAVTAARSLLDRREVEIVTRLLALETEEPAVFVHSVIADACRVTLRQANRIVRRAKTCTTMPAMGEALGQGASAAHVDVVTSELAKLDKGDRAALVARGPQLGAAARVQSLSDFGRTVRREIGRLNRQDPVARLARQQRRAAMETGIDPDTGMYWFRGELDPVTGAEFEGRLRNTIERMFRERVPDTCPADPLARRQHLAALALTWLVLGQDGAGGHGSAPPDITVLIDVDTLLNGRHPGSIFAVDGGLFDLPVDTIRRWACSATITPVVVADAGHRLFLGRATRLANRSQRQALRALYHSCALCDATFNHCKIHHVEPSEAGGKTDIDNLLPLCVRHHQLAHEGRWQLHLAADRTLTVVRPDGTVTIHAPPSALAA